MGILEGLIPAAIKMWNDCGLSDRCSLLLAVVRLGCNLDDDKRQDLAENHRSLRPATFRRMLRITENNGAESRSARHAER